MTRNKVSHSADLEAREIYEQIDNIQRFFEMFAENRPNEISQKKNQYVEKLNTLRLLAMDKLVREEQLKQV